MKRTCLLLLAAFLSLAGIFVSAARAKEGIALAIIYDTSGSMKDRVPAGPGKSLPKYVIANEALNAIVNRLEQYATNAPSGAPRRIDAGLFVFDKDSARAAVKFGPFDARAMRAWVKGFSQPDGGTPLGNALKVASAELQKSKLSHKHIVIITDGMNTRGPKPESVIPAIRKRAGGDLAFHFVAFDVADRVFAPVKKLGATVLGAANQSQLNTQLEFIFERKILLEDEDPRSPVGGKTQ